MVCERTYGIGNHNGKDCSTLSASILAYLPIELVSHTWLVCIIGIELGYQPRNDNHFNKECESV